MKGRLLPPWKRRTLFTRGKKAEELSDEVTNMLKKIVITLLVAIVISQLALQIPQVRIWVTGVDRLEGTPF